MEFFSLNSPISLSRPYEKVLKSIENQYDVSLTVHDLYGRLGNPQGNSIIPGRHLHPHKCCNRERSQNPEWNRICTEECFTNAERHAGTVLDPFLKKCWKGLIELVVPIIYKNSHQMTIFAGVFRDEGDGEQSMPKWFHDAYKQLSFPDEEKLHSLASLLKLLGLAIIEESDSSLIPEHNERLSLIRAFIRNRAHEDISLNDIAGELFVSVSRAGHIVKEVTGRPFQMLLEEERMLRARNLLLNSTRKLSDISSAVGYQNQFYFNRIFKRYFGITPGRFRKIEVSNASHQKH